MGIKLIVFDFDGTLADTYKIVFDIEHEMAKKYGLKRLEYSEVRDTKFSEVLIHDMHVSLIKGIRMFRKFEDEFNYRILDAKLFDGVVDVVGKLSKDYELGVYSTNITDDAVNNIRHVLVRAGIFKHFKFLNHSNFFFKKKMGLRKILKKNGLKPEEVLYVGDEIGDVVSCKAVGVKVVACSWGFNDKNTLLKYEPDYVCDKPCDILKVVGSKK